MEPAQISAWLERILPTVRRPARYTGGEWNARQGDWEGARVRVALAYPDLYDLGIANLGLMILYERINRTPGALAERVYAPWTDMAAVMRRDGMPLYGLESRHPLADFDMVGFSLPYELTYTNILDMLDLAGIPLLAEARTDRDPLVVGGGSGTYNPEPMAPFFDLFVVGEGEEAIDDLVALWMRTQEDGRDRDRFLREAAQVPGVYVPAFYQVRYHADGSVADGTAGDGTVAEIVPRGEDVPARVVKRVLADLAASPPVVRPVIPYIETVHDRAVVEIQRGCTRGCRFCQAGMIYRPVRERSPEAILAAVDELVAQTGYEELSLLSFSSSDYSQIEELLAALAAAHREQGLSLSLPSLRLDAFSVDLAETIAERRRTGLTFAPEAGTQRLRDVINKGLTEEDFRATLEAAFSRGWDRVKLYFMIGLPTETEEDLAGIVRMVREALAIGREHAGRRARINVSVASLVPKPHTPFQWWGQPDPEVLEDKIRFLQEGLRNRAIDLSWQGPATSRLEAALARGDRRLAEVILRAWEAGGRFDAWQEHFDPQLWWDAFEAAGLEPAFYANRTRPRDEVLPWEHISCGVSKAFLWREYQRALRGEPTPDCRTGPCGGCGVQVIVACPYVGEGQ